MRVAATRVGFYEKLRQPGEEFDIPAVLVSKNWMRAIEAAPAESVVVEASAEVLAAVVDTVKPRRGRRSKAVSE